MVTAPWAVTSHSTIRHLSRMLSSMGSDGVGFTWAHCRVRAMQSRRVQRRAEGRFPAVPRMRCPYRTADVRRALPLRSQVINRNRTLFADVTYDDRGSILLATALGRRVGACAPSQSYHLVAGLTIFKVVGWPTMKSNSSPQRQPLPIIRPLWRPERNGGGRRLIPWVVCSAYQGSTNRVN